MNIKIRTQTHWEKWRVATFYDKEPETIAWIDDFKDDGIFWDIGANIGVFSLWCAYRHPGMRVFAFEPLRANFLRLWENIFLNDFDRVQAHYVCLGAADLDGWFTADSAEIGSSGGQAGAAAGTGPQSYRIPMVTGDAMWGPCGAPNYIKIDVDGSELDILKGMPVMLANGALKGLLVEINKYESEIHDLLKKAGLVPDDRYNRLKTRTSDKNVIFKRGL